MAGRIIANMIGRNEAPHYLEYVLDRLSTQVDEIVFTDDASTDNTVDIVSKYTNHIQILPESMFSVHEGQLRQSSWDFLENVTNPSNKDWVLAIDCDEALFETQFKIRDLITSPNHDIMNIMFYHMWNENQFRVDGGWRPHGSTRLFRYQPNGKFADKKLAPGSEPQFVAWNFRYFRPRFFAQTGLKMKHLSYIKDEDKQAKYDRYTAIDGGAFHSNNHINSIIDPPEKVALEEWQWT